MLKTIIAKEMLDQFHNIRFFVLVVICMILFPLSAFVGYQDYHNRVVDYNNSVKLHQEKLDNLENVELFDGGFGVEGYLPPSSLSIFASGLTDMMPKKFVVKRDGLNFLAGDSSDEPVIAITGKLDYMFTIMVIFSLFSILLTFDTICGEKEKGTLKASLANAVPRNTIIFGKYIGTMLTILLPLFVSFLVSLILLILLGYPLFNQAIFIRIILILISSIIFISIFSCIGIFISSRVHGSKVSIVLLLSIWVLFIVIIPKSSNIIVKAIIPIRSGEVIQLEKYHLRHNLELEKGSRMDELDKTLPKFDRSHPEDYDHIRAERDKVLTPLRAEYRLKIAEGERKIERDYELEKQKQSSLTMTMARISPVTYFYQIITNLAWTGEQDKSNFKASARSYQQVVDEHVFNHIFRDVLPSGRARMGMSGNINFKNLPIYQYNEISLVDTFKVIFLDLMLFIVFAILSFVVAYVSFLKYDVR
jgi:ABC-type transport system involved in multi-copper enzyme maturation permease subunit